MSKHEEKAEKLKTKIVAHPATSAVHLSNLIITKHWGTKTDSGLRKDFVALLRCFCLFPFCLFFPHFSCRAPQILAFF